VKIACSSCGQPYPDSGLPYKCPQCGGVYDYAEPLTFGEVDPSRDGLGRYASSLGLPAALVSLGEGNTPLVPVQAFGREIHFKCEYCNPSGSFKDRGTAALVSFLCARGVTAAVEDSSGNAGASFAAYAARAGIRARLYVPDTASGPKRRQMECYGAELSPIPGPRSKASEAARRTAEAGMVYASHAYLPFNLPGYATCAYEIYEQLRSGPGSVIVPAGQGGLLLGLGRGFEALRRAGRIGKLPVLLGVQAGACAPLHALWKDGRLDDVQESPTIAEGVCTRWPVRARAVVEAARRSGGGFESVDEAFILSGRDALARLGFYVEPTSALVWRALEEAIANLPDPVVVVLTGSGLKYLL